MSAEEWRPVPGCPSYLVSDQGRVASLRTWKGQPGPRILKAHPNHFGYPYVQLWGYGNGGSRNRLMRSVHSLVAAAFLGPRPEGMEVRHLDGDPANCSAGNLAYGTHVDNEHDKLQHGTHPSFRTHCVNGHEFDEINTYRDPRTGRRYCRPCTRLNSRRYRARRKAA